MWGKGSELKAPKKCHVLFKPVYWTTNYIKLKSNILNNKKR